MVSWVRSDIAVSTKSLYLALEIYRFCIATDIAIDSGFEGKPCVDGGIYSDNSLCDIVRIWSSSKWSVNCFFIYSTLIEAWTSYWLYVTIFCLKGAFKLDDGERDHLTRF